jgi:hypothetical protein
MYRKNYEHIKAHVLKREREKIAMFLEIIIRERGHTFQGISQNVSPCSTHMHILI